MTKLLLATRNKGKIREMVDLLHTVKAEIITPRDLEIELDVEERGKTYAENAARKALAYASLSNYLALGDDSGLEVEALGGAPGIYSARYSPKPGATDKDRRDYLLAQLQDQGHVHQAAGLATQRQPVQQDLADSIARRRDKGVYRDEH